MADSNARELLTLGDRMFARKSQIDTLWQTIADEVYPERATFTKQRVEGDEFAEDLYTSLPAQNRRDLAYAIGALTRPKSQQWFDPKAQEDERNTPRVKEWFSQTRDKQRTLLYTRKALFQQAMQVSDNDFVSFGNAVIGHAEDDDRSGIMVFQPYHLRDCAWAHDHYKQVNVVHRKFKIELRSVVAKWGEAALSGAQKRTYEKYPYEEVEFRHCVMPNEDYEAYLRAKPRRNWPFASVYINPDNQSVIKEGGYYEFPYTVRRWFLDDQSPYAYSPSAMLGLVEARLLQSQERTIMEAGERIVDPPSVATRDAVLGKVANYAGATTWIDPEYDQRTGRALEFIETRANIPIGLEMKQDTRQILAACWFINKLSLPPEKDMTAFEVNERIGEYIRTIGPAIEPFEADNAAILDMHFQFCLRLGHFTGGIPVMAPDYQGLQAVPPEIRGTDVIYEFDGPVQMAYKRQKLMKAKEIRMLAAESMQFRPESADNYNFDRIERDAVDYIGAEPGWLIPEQDVAQVREQRAQAAQQQQQQQQMEMAGQTAKDIAETTPKVAQAVNAVPQIAASLQGQGVNLQDLVSAAQTQGGQGANDNAGAAA